MPVVTQIGKALGACVIAVARGPDKCAVLEGLGADLVIDTSTLRQPLKAAIKEVAPKGTSSSAL
jgi:NADPH2:quinone reductase